MLVILQYIYNYMLLLNWNFLRRLKTLKKILFALVTLFFLTLFVSCSNDTENEEASDSNTEKPTSQEESSPEEEIQATDEEAMAPEKDTVENESEYKLKEFSNCTEVQSHFDELIGHLIVNEEISYVGPDDFSCEYIAENDVASISISGTIINDPMTEDDLNTMIEMTSSMEKFEHETVNSMGGIAYGSADEAVSLRNTIVQLDNIELSLITTLDEYAGSYGEDAIDKLVTLVE